LAEPEKNGTKLKAEGSPTGAPDALPADQASAETLAPEMRRLADGCFDRAQQATVHSNFDYAIALYLDGLRYNPQDIEKGHKGLREAAVRRKSQGKGGWFGKLLSQIRSAVFQMLGRHKDAMLALEAALAHDPQNVMYLTQMMQLARRLEYVDVAIWSGELAAEETLKTRKPQKQIFTTLADLYEDQRRFRDAVEALNQAIKIDPSDRTLDKRARDLAASSSIEDGKFESVTDFHDMIRDRRQATASATQQVIRTEEQLDDQYAELKVALDADPENPVKMQALADCQARRGNIPDAMAILKKALETGKDYRYKYRMDDIYMAEYRARLRDLDVEIEANPDRADLKAEHKKISQEQDAFELKAYQERQRQYPTDLGIRLDLGIRQYRKGLFDEAIVSFQQASRDPKRHVQALNLLGQCFFAKKLYQEAQNQFETALERHEITGDALAKELQYHLAMTLEIQGKLPGAIEWFSRIVQQDYQYRDAAKRLEALRRSAEEQGKPA